MRPVPRYAQRIARLPQVLDTLGSHPGGLPISTLADELGVPVEELREDLLAFYAADVGTMLLGLSRPDALEFLGPDGDDADPSTAEVVRVVDGRPAEELGVEYLDASQLAQVYAAGRALLDVEPDNTGLEKALASLAGTMFGQTGSPTGSPSGSPTDPHGSSRPLEELRHAAEQRRSVRLVYSRTWHAGVTERVVDPYRLVQTRRGWEVDAGPPDDEGRLRTYLLSNIREAAVLAEQFSPPPDLERRLAEQRSTTTVRVQIPHAARWAADFFAERVDVVLDEDYASTLDLTLLPPVESRIGLLILAAGDSMRVVEPAGLVASGPRLAAALLAHHREWRPRTAGSRVERER